MKDLIEALTILQKYMDPENRWPTHCEHDVLYVCGLIDPVSREDEKRLEQLGFTPSDEHKGTYKSFRFGSC